MRSLAFLLLLCAGVTGHAQSLSCVGDSCCLEGTVWSEELGGCVVANVSDVDFDGCVGINDFLVHLSNFGGGCGPGPAWTCGDPLEYQGYDYETVQIGEQCWFAENLRSGQYRNGDSIPSGLSDLEWSTTSSGATSINGEGESLCVNGSPDGDACEISWSLSEYGRLYNFYAVADPRDLCPIDWHIPSDDEWITMEIEIGMSELEANDVFWRGGDQGTQLKTTYGWSSQGDGTNTSGFWGLPGGDRFQDGAFQSAGVSGHWWTSSPDGSAAWLRWLYYLNDGVYRVSGNMARGFSVRCIKD